MVQNKVFDKGCRIKIPFEIGYLTMFVTKNNYFMMSIPKYMQGERLQYL